MLKKIANRHTPQRRLILALVKLADHPLTAEEVLQRARQRLQGVSVSTVYRNLDLLAGAGEIFRVITPDGVTRFAGTARPQVFFTCTNCGDQQVLDGSGLQAGFAALLPKVEIGYSVSYVQGRCARCSAKSRRRYA